MDVSEPGGLPQSGGQAPPGSQLHLWAPASERGKTPAHKMAISMISMGKVRFESTGTCFFPKIFRQTELRMGTIEEMK